MTGKGGGVMDHVPVSTDPLPEFFTVTRSRPLPYVPFSPSEDNKVLFFRDGSVEGL